MEDVTQKKKVYEQSGTYDNAMAAFGIFCPESVWDKSQF